jgi:Family of unknown function (DUF6493)
VSDLENRLVALIEAADEPGIVALLAPLTEAERAELVPAVVDQVRRHKADHDNTTFPPRPDYEDVTARTHAAFLAWLGTDGLDGLPPRPPPDGFDHNQMRWFLHRAGAGLTGFQVLRDRLPEWLPVLADQFLEYGYWMWDPVWQLVMDGVIERPTSPRYLEGVARYLGRSEQWPVEEMVRRDPLLYERDFPALLDLPGGLGMLCHGDHRQRGMGRERTDFRAWSPVLAALPSGHPVRDRLLTDLLDALGGDLGREASAYQSFLTELRPSLAEYADRRHALLRLVGHRQSATVSFAVSTLSKVDKKHPLDPDEVVARLGPATGASSASAARSAVRLIATAVHRRPELAGVAASALAPALTDRRPDIQREAVTLLSAYTGDTKVAAALTAAAPHLAPTAAAALPTTIENEPPDGDGLEEAMTEAAEILAGVSDVDLAAALAAARTGIEPGPIEPDPLREARPSGRAVTPVEGLDDLVETLLHVVDGQIRATSTIERGLDGLAALHLERPAEFGLRVGPLIVRINKTFEDRPQWGDHFTSDFCYLVAQWIEPHRAIAEPYTVDNPRTWLIARLREVAAMIQAGTAARLLAPPTDENDWIEPAVLARRAIHSGDEALRRPYDVATAIGRLAPWRRAEAAQMLEGVDGVLAAVVRNACGGEEPADGAPDVVRRALAWHRERPAGAAPYLFGELPPTGPTEMGYPSGVSLPTWIEAPDGTQILDPNSSPEWHAYRRWRDHALHTGYGFVWALSQWPGDLGWVWSDELWSRHAMRDLLDPGAALPVAAVTRLIELIGDGAANHRTLAGDILAQSIGDGRLTSDRLGAAIRDGMGSGDRLATELVTVAGTSALHRAVVARAIAATMPAWTEKAARPLCTVLALLDDAFTGDRTGLAEPEARAALTALSQGRSKSATLARRVLAHEPADRWTPAAAAAALRTRMDRAKRRTNAV